MVLLAGSFGGGAACVGDYCATGDPHCDVLGRYVALYQPEQPTEPTVPTWVAVASSGGIAYSNDGASWSNESLGGDNLQGVAYGSAGFVAVGNNGRVLTSTSGQIGTWVDRTPPTAQVLSSIAYSDGLYVAVGGTTASNDLILTSTDGVTWTDRSLGLADFFRTMIHTENGFLSVGRSGVRATSPDGLTWTDASAGGLDWRAVAFGNSLYIQDDGGGNLHTSATTGGLPNATGNVTPSANSESALFFEPVGLFIFGGDDGRIVSTADGVGTATLVDNTSSELKGDAATDGSRIVFASDLGELAHADSDLNFTYQTIGAANWNGVTYGAVPESLLTNP